MRMENTETTHEQIVTGKHKQEQYEQSPTVQGSRQKR